MFIAWPEIKSFHNLRASLLQFPETLSKGTQVRYNSKIKLHGTNAAIQVHDKAVYAQSREQLITPEKDNCGFAAWVEKVKDPFLAVRETLGRNFILYGEWAGPKVQKGVAITQIPWKIFAVFSAAFLDDQNCITDEMIVDPEELKAFVGAIEDVYVLPWYKEGYEVDFQGNFLPVLDLINQQVAEIEACDPWVKSTFGIEGVGEGLVFYPQGSYKGREHFTNLCFKAKGEKHAVVAHTKPAQADPTVAADADKFAEMVVTTARLEQGAQKVGSTYSTQHISAFLKWIEADILKESQPELVASALEPKLALKACNTRARNWYLAQVKNQ